MSAIRKAGAELTTVDSGAEVVSFDDRATVFGDFDGLTEALALLRVQRKVSKAELARRIGRDRQAVERAECGSYSSTLVDVVGECAEEMGYQIRFVLVEQ
ncbi:helix-turn-helix domain-containing protein [Amycolatopsis sp. NPDC059021]|uniref:helix-turn-helix domain-containing protein n=1 Tax=Amycolatopsis sp. NPDC059021 TaxID=3346704 RepID=UPI0036707E7A